MLDLFSNDPDSMDIYIDQPSKAEMSRRLQDNLVDKNGRIAQKRIPVHEGHLFPSTGLLDLSHIKEGTEKGLLVPWKGTDLCDAGQRRTRSIQDIKPSPSRAT